MKYLLEHCKTCQRRAWCSNKTYSMIITREKTHWFVTVHKMIARCGWVEYIDFGPLATRQEARNLKRNLKYSITYAEKLTRRST